MCYEGFTVTVLAPGNASDSGGTNQGTPVIDDYSTVEIFEFLSPTPQSPLPLSPKSTTDLTHPRILTLYNVTVLASHGFICILTGQLTFQCI